MAFTLHSGLCKRCNVESKFGHGHGHGGHGHSHGGQGHSNGDSGHSHTDNDHGDEGNHHSHREHYQNQHTDCTVTSQEMAHPSDFRNITMGTATHSLPGVVPGQSAEGSPTDEDHSYDVYQRQNINNGIGQSDLHCPPINGINHISEHISEISTERTDTDTVNSDHILNVDNVIVETPTDHSRTKSTGLLDKLIGDPDANINIKAAMVHVLGDLLQSIGVLIAAGIVKSDPSRKIADPICTFLFSVIVLVTTFTVLRDILLILLEAVPRSSDFSGIAKDLQELEGVKTAHNIHVWALTLDKVVVAVHLAADPAANFSQIVVEGTKMLRKKHSVFHSTIQVEPYVGDQMSQCDQCSSPGSTFPLLRRNAWPAGNAV